MLKCAFITTEAGLMLVFLLLAVNGCSKSSSTGPTGNGTGRVITVIGRVVDGNGQSMSNVKVFVVGKLPSNSDANGNFSFTNVSTPYDIGVVDSTSGIALTHVFKELTRTDPTLWCYRSAFGGIHYGTVSGSISGGTFTPEGANVDFASPEAFSSTSAAANGAFTFGPKYLVWYGPPVTTGIISALQHTTDGKGIPVYGFGVKSGVTVNDGGTLSNQFDTLEAISTNQFTGTVTIPSGYTLISKALLVKISQFDALQVVYDYTEVANLSYFTPDIPGASLLVGIYAYNFRTFGTAYFWKYVIGTGATGVPINVIAAPELDSPADAATGIDTSVTFSWTSMPGAVYLVEFWGSSVYPRYYVVTSGTSVSIPNMKSLGLGLPSSAPYYWDVYGIVPFNNVDAAAGAAGFLIGLRNLPAAAKGDLSYGVSTVRSFTTAH